MNQEWSGRALSLCLACDLVWSLGILAACTYVVFWMNQSGWWYLLAIVLGGMWNCKPYRSPAQIAADPATET